MKIDMHIHSNYSLDGELSITELIRKFSEEDFKIISITDHNTCDAYKEIGNTRGIKVVNGIEMDAIINNHTYEFLCYDFELDKVADYVNKQYESIEKRQRKIFNALVQLCKERKIELENVASYDASKEYAHAAIYRMLNKTFLNKYNITCINDFYRLSTIDEKFPLYIDMHIVWPDISELSDIIHKAGGKIFLAHPYKYNRSVDEVLKEASKLIDGIEISNNPKDDKEVKYLYEYAINNNLLISCGSDYHGSGRHCNRYNYLTEEMIKGIISWLK